MKTDKSQNGDAVRQPRTALADAISSMSRRSFIQRMASLGASAALPLGMAGSLVGCGGGDDDDTPPPPARPTETRTLFFNLSHEDHAGRTYYLTGGGQRLTLVSVKDQPEVLQRARATNSFLAAVPDAQITHHVADAPFVTDSVTLCYISTDLDAAAGTWSMSAVQLVIPTSGSPAAYASARAATPSGPLPISARRAFYGLPAAQTEQDLRDELDLFDATSHAATLVSMHPDLACLEPGAAHTVVSVHVNTDLNVVLLGQRLAQGQYGPATMQETAGHDNASGWATLLPVLDDNGQPLRNATGKHKGRIQYQPKLNPALEPFQRTAMTAQTHGVQNDPSLGADVTGAVPADPNGDPPTAFSGKKWQRHDGLANVDQSPSLGLAATSGGMTLKEQNGQAFYVVQASAVPSGATFKVSLTLLNFFLQFRGVYLQFLDTSGNPLKLSTLDEYSAGTIVPNHDKSLDTDTDFWISLIGPVFTVLAIPTAPSFIQPVFTVPERASTVRILSSTMSTQGGNTYPDTVVGASIMTGVFNYGVTALLAAAGGGPFIPAMYKAVVLPLAQILVSELTTIISASLANNNPGNLVGLLSTPNFWIGQSLVLAKLIVTQSVGTGVKALAAWIAGQITLGVAEDSVPLAGQIMQAVSIAVGVASLAETTAEMATTPWTFIHDLVFTHDLSVTILKDSGDPHANPPDPGDDTFPKAANAYTVTALFDSGTPHVQTFDLAAPVPSTLPPVVFKDVPLGGWVNVKVAFVQKALDPTKNEDILLGQGSTGLFENTVDTASITIQELKFPIGPNTTYQHRQKTSLDAAGNHRWAAAAAPTTNEFNSVCGGPGTVCQFNSITVRQGTSSTAGFVGYSWQGQNSDPSRAPSCIGGGSGQLDQAASLNTDSGNNGANAQNGYTNLGCGVGQPGVRVAYSLLDYGAQNFYLDSSNPLAPMIRKVVLDGTPQFASPLSGQSFGVLNFASDRLLLHPQGHVVSISAAAHKIETHRLPQKPSSDTDAMTQLLAQPKSGKGSRPGLIDAPAAMAIGSNGVILILENGNNRIQALDLGGNPIPYFSKQSVPYTLVFSATDSSAGQIYLDMAVEYTGYIYVLSYQSNASPFVYRLDIYHPDQAGSAPIATTMSINAARLAVDYWRNVYTLNYEVLQLPGPAPAPFTEPSVSLWTPCAAGQTC